MKREFIGKLEKKLRVLNRREREQYLNQYEEIILEKAEHGISEEQVITEFGNIKIIAEEILGSYVSEKRKLFVVDYKYINPGYFFTDIIGMILACFLSTVICSFFALGNSAGAYGNYVLFIVSFVCTYFVYGLYSIKIMRKKKQELKRIIFSNVTAVLMVLMILYLFNDFNFSRVLVFATGGINILICLFLRWMITN